VPLHSAAVSIAAPFGSSAIVQIRCTQKRPDWAGRGRRVRDQGPACRL